MEQYIKLYASELDKMQLLPFAGRALYLHLKRNCDFQTGKIKTWLSELAEAASEPKRPNSKQTISTTRSGVDYLIRKMTDLGLIERSGSKTDGVIITVLSFLTKKVSTEFKQGLNKVSTESKQENHLESDSYNSSLNNVSTESKQGLNKVHENNHIITNNNHINTNKTICIENPSADADAPAATTAHDNISESSAEKPKKPRTPKKEAAISPEIKSIMDRVSQIVASGGYIYPEKELATKVKGSIKRHGLEKVHSFIEDLEFLKWDEIEKFYPFSKNESSPHYVFGSAGSRDFFEELSAKVKTRVNQLHQKSQISDKEQEIIDFFKEKDITPASLKNNVPALAYEGGASSNVVVFQNKQGAVINQEPPRPKSQKEREEEYKNIYIELHRRAFAGDKSVSKEIQEFSRAVAERIGAGRNMQIKASAVGFLHMEDLRKEVEEGKRVMITKGAF